MLILSVNDTLTCSSLLIYLHLYYFYQTNCSEVAWILVCLLNECIDVGCPTRWRAIDALFQNTCVFASSPQTFEWKQHRRGCSTVTLLSGNIRFMRGFPEEGASNDSGVIENVDFQVFRTQRLRHLKMRPTLLFSPLSPCHWPHCRHLGKFRMVIFLQRVMQFISLLVYGRVSGWRIECLYFRLNQIKDHGRQPSSIELPYLWNGSYGPIRIWFQCKCIGENKGRGVTRLVTI